MPDEGALPWDRLSNSCPVKAHTSQPVVVIGAGLAGCWTARTLAENGIKVVVLESGPNAASGASSNPAGIVKPFVTRSPCHAMSFYLAAYAYLLERLQQWNLNTACSFHACGVTQLVQKPYPTSMHYECVSSDNLGSTLGVQAKGNAIRFAHSGWLNPNQLCRSLLAHDAIELNCNQSVSSVEACVKEFDADHVVLATGTALSSFSQTHQLPIVPARGQISRFKVPKHQSKLKQVVSGKHYIIPDNDSVIVGATFERGVTFDDVKEADNQANLYGLQATLKGFAVDPIALDAYAGVRATTPDRLPLLGPAPNVEQCAHVYSDLHHGKSLDSYPSLPIHENLSVFSGLGSRGIVTAPYCAYLLSDYLSGGHAINPWLPLINPVRFVIRNLKKGLSAAG